VRCTRASYRLTGGATTEGCGWLAWRELTGLPARAPPRQAAALTASGNGLATAWTADRSQQAGRTAPASSGCIGPPDHVRPTPPANQARL